MISFDCPSCSQTYTVPDEAAGKRTKCKRCGGDVVVPPRPTPPPVGRYVVQRWGRAEPQDQGKVGSPAPAASAVRLTCPKCATVFEVSASVRDPFVRCACGTILVVPGRESNAPDPASDPRDPEPESYGKAVRCVAHLLLFSYILGGVAVLACFIGVIVSVEQKWGPLPTLAYAVAAIGSGASILVVELAAQLVLVVVDHARNTRIIRRELVAAGFRAGRSGPTGG